MIKKIIIAAIILAGIGFAVYQYSMKRVPDNTDVNPTMILSFDELNTKMNLNDSAAFATYTNKVVAINGMVKNIDNSDSLVTVIIGDTTSMNTIICQADNRHLPDFTSIKQNTNIRIKGMCAGYYADEMGLGNSLQLKNCVIHK
jgi:tRNA_anti-like